MKTAAHNYELVRFFADGSPPQVLRTGLTLEQAQGACRSDTTRKAGEWTTMYRETYSEKRERLAQGTRRGQASITKALLHSTLGPGRATSGTYPTE